MALPPSTHPMLSGRVTKGRWTFPTPRISTETLYQCGNHQLINNQTIWYRIRNFGDDHHVGDLPWETPITKGIRRVNSFYAEVEIAPSRVSRVRNSYLLH